MVLGITRENVFSCLWTAVVSLRCRTSPFLLFALFTPKVRVSRISLLHSQLHQSAVRRWTLDGLAFHGSPGFSLRRIIEVLCEDPGSPFPSFPSYQLRFAAGGDCRPFLS